MIPLESPPLLRVRWARGVCQLSRSSTRSISGGWVLSHDMGWSLVDGSVTALSFTLRAINQVGSAVVRVRAEGCRGGAAPC